MGKDAVRYVAVCIGIYLSLALIAFFPLAPLSDFISFDYRVHLLLAALFLLIIDPVLTWFLADRFRFKEEQEENDGLL